MRQSAARLLRGAARRLHDPQASLGEQGADYYGRIPPKYLLHYTESPYHFLWTVIVDRLRPLNERRVLEVACGTGQLAMMLLEYGATNYVGFDFSAERVQMAQGIPLTFHLADALTTDLFESDYDTVIATEFLEHVEADLQVLDRIRLGTRVLATVPNYDAPSHVRTFPTPADVADRYADYFSEFDVTYWWRTTEKVLYLIDGIR